jgi:Flp pilus assembly protein protease CpaA
MREGIVETLSSLLDVRYLPLYKVLILGLALSFFTGVYVLGALFRRRVSLSKAAATITPRISRRGPGSRFGTGTSRGR